MHKKTFFIIFLAAGMVMTAQAGFESDVFTCADGVLRITFIGHASLLFQFQQSRQPAATTIYLDPDGRRADFSKLPKADLVLITHQHGDHFDPESIAVLRQPSTRIIATSLCLPLPAGASIMKNGDRTRFADVDIEAVPAYNVLHKRDDGRPFHPRGEGNGYVLDFSGFRVYVAGDTENIPEMAALHDIAVAFLPMNLPYTMTPEMAALAAKMIKPRVLYPYHYSGTDPLRLVELLKEQAGMDVRIRKLQ